MNKFLSRLFLFIIPIFIIGLGFDLYITQRLKYRNDFSKGENGVWNDIYNQELNKVDGVIYGSSRAWVHIDPKILEEKLQIPFYNLGVDGHNFHIQYLRHQELIKYNSFPKYIVYSVDVNTLAKREDLYNYEQFLPYMLWNENIIDYTSGYKGFSFIDYYFPLMRYMGESEILTSALFKEDIQRKPRYKGYRGVKETWNEDFKKAKKKFKNYKIQVDSKSIRNFENFLKEALDHKTRIVLVYTPEYMEGQNFVRNRGEIVDIFRKLSKKYEIPFLDYSEHSINRNKKYFYNASHLNKDGSELFSRILAEDLSNHNIF